MMTASSLRERLTFKISYECLIEDGSDISGPYGKERYLFHSLVSDFFSIKSMRKYCPTSIFGHVLDKAQSRCV